MIQKKPNINLFIVGAAKSGTTSLYHYLNQHPDVCFPNVKEPNYYADIESEDSLVYKKPKEGVLYHNKIINDESIYFSLYKNSLGYKIVGDASPSYLWDLKAAKKIYADFPTAKIIIILRNPVARTFSHYLMNIKSGVEKETDFLKALLRDKKIEPKVWGDGKVLLYEDLGMYYNQVKAYFETFDKKNIKIIIYEDFFQNIETGLIDILKFLELETSKLNEINYKTIHNKYSSPKNGFSRLLLKNKNKLAYIRKFIPNKLKSVLKNKIIFKDSKKPILTESVNNYLTKVFKKDIIKLEKLLNKKLDLWKI